MNEGISKLSRPFYLANVLSIARADDQIQAGESEVLHAIVKRIGATEQDVADATRLLASGRYQLQLPDRPSERMANIEDMILVALAHGDVSPGEAEPIEQAAKLLGFVQTDMDMAVHRAEQALRKLKAKKAPVGPLPPPPPKPSPPAPPVPPPRPRPAPLRPSHSQTGQPIAPMPPPPKPPLAPRPASARTMAPATPPTSPKPDVANHPPTEILPRDDTASGPSRRVKACMACRAASEDPAAYCFGRPDGDLNVWGCRLAGMDWTPGAAWLGLGAFRDNTTFALDKQTIADRLSTNLAGVLQCPHLDVDYTEKAFDALPNRIRARGHWRYRNAEAGDSDAMTVHVTRFIHGCPLVMPQEVSGIDPVGTRDAEKVIRRAMKASGRHDVDPRQWRAPG